jgi:hypothetical protein
MRRLLLSGLLCMVAAADVAALDGPVESAGTLNAFTGIWTHSDDDCKKRRAALSIRVTSIECRPRPINSSASASMVST